jgi:hypothetical protein
VIAERMRTQPRPPTASVLRILDDPERVLVAVASKVLVTWSNRTERAGARRRRRAMNLP